MDKRFLFFLSLTLCFLGLINCQAEKQPNELRILYLGGQSDWDKGDLLINGKLATEEEFQKTITERMEGFGKLLRSYFDSVTVMRAADYTPEMSDNYDVTIFDGLPPAQDKKSVIKDSNGKIFKFIEPRYLPDDFSAASITIGTVGNSIGRRIGSKNDWYCLCLDADAHGMNLEHPIFKGPFKTTITLTKKLTPKDAYEYQYFQKEPLPDSVMMWKVNTKGYMTEKAYAAGMVARPWGYTDSPDAEVISSGVCAKTIDAVALGRHGNMFSWGFIGSPQYMTDEAKKVFVNTVAYMAKHKGTAIARKEFDRRACRDYILELMHYAKHSTYLKNIKLEEEFRAMCVAEYKKVRAKQERGEELAPNEQSTLEYGEPKFGPLATFAEFLKDNQKGLFDHFGEDTEKYIQYYEENIPYFYGLPGYYKIEVDEDAKAWQIPNNDIRLLEKAVECLEEGMEVERANRILERYTLCEFTQPSEWRAWLNKYRDKIFFTESCGWFFMVNEPGAPGNDYKVLERREAEKEVRLKVAEGTENNVQEPDAMNPVIVQAYARKDSDNTATIELSIRIMHGFHIYQVVGDADPYLPLKLDFPMAEGCSLVGIAKMPPAKPYGAEGTRIYEDNVVITQQVKCDKMPETLSCKISFQCCDAHVCMPPVEKVLTVTIP